MLAAAAGDAGLGVDEARQLLDGTGGLAELQAELAAAADAGIAAVPTYVIDRRFSIPGAQDPDVFVQVMAPSADRAG